MIQTITHIMIISSLIIFGTALIICLSRLIKGPTIADHAVIFSTTGAIVISIAGALSVLMDTVSFLDSIVLIATASLVSSVSISHFIGRGHVFNGSNKRNL